MAEESEFVSKFGPVHFEFIDVPPSNGLIVRPYAHNFFYKGKLYRTRGERTSGKFELFVDLLYVGIIAALAADATAVPTGGSLLKFILLFWPAWQVWSDIRDFMNYYYNNDLIQRTYVVWLMALLLVYANNADAVLDGPGPAALVVVPYILARVTTAAMFFSYSFFVYEHSFQMRLYSVLIVLTACVWIPVIWVSTRAKIGIAFACLALEAIAFLIAYHPNLRKVFKKNYGTAVNIEHDVERLTAFSVIAIGEFLLTIVYKAGPGLNAKLGRAILTLLIAYSFSWFYFNGSGSRKAIHPLRRVPATAFLWFYCHLPFMGSIILAADACAEMVLLENTSTKKETSHGESAAAAEGETTTASSHVAANNAEAVGQAIVRLVMRATEAASSSSTESEGEEHESLYSLQFFVTGGLCVALLSLTALAWLEKDMDEPGDLRLPKFWRLILRVPAAVTILCLAFAEMNTTLLLGVIAIICNGSLAWETFGAAPSNKMCDSMAEEMRNHHRMRRERVEQWNAESRLENAERGFENRFFRRKTKPNAAEPDAPVADDRLVDEDGSATTAAGPSRTDV